MDADKQKQLVREMGDRMLTEMLQAIDRGDVPEEWNGIQLRQWLADKANQFPMWRKGDPRDRRLRREYESTVLSNRLL